MRQLVSEGRNRPPFGALNLITVSSRGKFKRWVIRCGCHRLWTVRYLQGALQILVAKYSYNLIHALSRPLEIPIILGA